jgi:S1-C subfamily serine protease
VRQSIQIAVILFLAGMVAGCGVDILAAVVIGSATKRDTYCQTSSGGVYMRPGADGECNANDKEIAFEEYRLRYRENAEQETRKLIAANEAARNAKAFCATALSSTPYIAASGQCQRGDVSISESEYNYKKAAMSDSLSSPPKTPIVAGGEADTDRPAQSVAAAPPPASPSTETPKRKEPVTKSAPRDTPIPDDARAVASGTAFFIAGQGRLLTNRHVVEGCDWIGLMAEGDLHTAVTVAESSKLDLAVLQTDFDGNAIAVFADEAPEIGEDSYVAGYPLLDKLWSLNFTNGIISSQAPLGEERLLQTTAPVQHGNSGGPMFDASGHVAGVVVARLADKSAENVNFAIKSTVATEFISQSGVSPRIASRSAELKPSVIARTARSIVVPAICFKRG